MMVVSTVSTVSTEAIIAAAAAQSHLPVGEGLQQRYRFSRDHEFHAESLSETTPCQWALAQRHEDGVKAPPVLRDLPRPALAVQVKAVHAGAALWLPSQQGCNWPVNVMLEVFVFSSKIVPGGVDITVVADAVSAAQRLVLAHGGPLPLHLQHSLARPSRNSNRMPKGAVTAFTAKQSRRNAHIDVLEAGVWVQEHFVFPALTFQKQSNMVPLSLMFAVTAEPTFINGANGYVAAAATILLPRTVSMRSMQELSAAVRVLGLPEDISDRICRRRHSDAASARMVPMHMHTHTHGTAPSASALPPAAPQRPGRAHSADRALTPVNDLEHHVSGAHSLTLRRTALASRSLSSLSWEPLFNSEGTPSMTPPHGPSSNESSEGGGGHVVRAGSHRYLDSVDRGLAHLGFAHSSGCTPDEEAEQGKPERVLWWLLRLPSLEQCEAMLDELLSDRRG